MFANNQLVKGILIGAGVSLAAFCVYKSNEEKVDQFLNRHGIHVKTCGNSLESMSIEELMRQKEDIEDLIAEKELQDQSVTVNAPVPAT